ncbi:MAG: hypothetical protein H7A33_04590 [Deltaproteobacteria bacterium]|nr:hypothetical protein [Deltaproteobacteria bacterium]
MHRKIGISDFQETTAHLCFTKHFAAKKKQLPRKSANQSAFVFVALPPRQYQAITPILYSFDRADPEEFD